VFDGTGAAPRPATVLIQDDRIIAVGADVKVPSGAKVIEARGKALTPGFYDLHTHWTVAASPMSSAHRHGLCKGGHHHGERFQRGARGLCPAA
jgi:imidazolonepropionase-like amidohydrolase